MTVVGTYSNGIREPGLPAARCPAVRRIVTVPATSSIAVTVPTAACARGSSTRRPTLAAWSWGGKAYISSRPLPPLPTGPRSATSLTIPIGSRSSTRSSSVVPQSS